MSSSFEPTRGDLARDNLVVAVGNAHSRLLSTTRMQLTVFLAGPRNVPAAYELAQVLMQTTSDEDLALLLARLLLLVDDQVMAGATAAPVASAPHPGRRATDTVEG